MLAAFGAAVAANIAANGLMMPPAAKPVWRGKAKLAANPFGGGAQRDTVSLGYGADPLASSAMDVGWSQAAAVADSVSWPAPAMPAPAAPEPLPVCAECGAGAGSQGKAAEGCSSTAAELLLWAAAGAAIARARGESLYRGALAGAIVGWMLGGSCDGSDS